MRRSAASRLQLDVATQHDAVAAERTVSFVNDVMPVFTKAGCNVGVCHAKAGGGQNGFQLSLLGFEPAEDFEHIVLEGRGRRLSFAHPTRACCCSRPPAGAARRRRAAGLRPRRLCRDPRLDSPGRAAAMTARDPAAGRLGDRAEAAVRCSARRQQQLKALARYSDGSVRDVTGLALFESNDKAMAEVIGEGLVKVLDLPGKVSVMVRYQGQVAVFNATVPLGAPVGHPAAGEELHRRRRLCQPEGTRHSAVARVRRRHVPAPRHPGHRRAAADRGRGEGFPGQHRAPTSATGGSTSCCEAPTTRTSSPASGRRVLKNRRDDASDIVSNFAFHAWVRDSLLANKPYDQFVRELLAATGTVDRQPAGRLVQAGEGAEGPDRGRGPALPGRAHAVRPVPPPPVRALEPGRLLRAGGVLLARWAASPPAPAART